MDIAFIFIEQKAKSVMVKSKQCPGQNGCIILLIQHWFFLFLNFRQHANPTLAKNAEMWSKRCVFVDKLGHINNTGVSLDA